MLQSAGIEVAGTTGDAPGLRALVLAHAPQLVISDIRMPPGYADDELHAALHVRRTRPGTAIMLLSQHLNRRYALELLADGFAGVGYLLKQRLADPHSFCRDVRHVAAGGTVLDPDIIATLLAHTDRDNHPSQ